jgi:nuclear transcription Y subunit beta
MSDSPQSPPKEVDQGAPSPDEEAQMNEQQHDPQGAGTASYEFEGVKEQDRWLPIANGRSSIPPQRFVVICSSFCMSCLAV